ncbi:hypothetical protein ACIQ7D_17740 [Streptomyces sp. NPDC096310]|uniref:hypothetical protein n=1 Tax=Streptomyces sp. NPDC096310 TaxID=3366082 RepID=UPI00381284C5
MTVLRRSLPSPFGCRWCGIARRSHGRQWIASQGWHAWEQPTNAQILARMRARRAAPKES